MNHFIKKQRNQKQKKVTNHQKLSNNAIKSVTVTHPNYQSLSKLSKIVTQLPETVENPNIFYGVSVTIEHPQTTIKLSKPRKHSKIITGKRKYKIKDYRQTKSDCKQQLELIRRHNNLPKNCSQLYGIKILYSKQYDEQLNLTRSHIKNKLFEITKELNELKFQQNIQGEFMKDDKVVEETILVGPLHWFK